MTSKKLFTEYCTGCGLCVSVNDIFISENSKGYPSPVLNDSEVSLCEKVCPSSGNALKNYQDGTIWGKYNCSLLGWSSNKAIRKGASSGGVLTTLCLYLLENKLVDGIIQTRCSRKDIRKTETIVSKSKEDVLTCMGSRYTVSSPLYNIDSMIQKGEKYAFIGKPCDVSALRILMEEIQPELKKQIIYLFSFFCAGQPSIHANNKLLIALGGEKLDECSDLQYRGNGWPGYASLTKIDGTKKTMDYETSWMKILGRDVRKICRFCADGTGELADISCGDAWYLDEKGKPDFSEREGRNVIFARTDAGSILLDNVVKDGLLEVQEFNPEKDGLSKMQPYHYTRKASLLIYKYALHLCGRDFPRYDKSKLAKFAKGFSIKQKILRFGGTVQRVMKGTI